MDLYLMQHGQAMTEAEDPERPLTEAGRAAVQRVAARARTAGVRIGHCVHSGKLPAEQTARLSRISTRLGFAGKHRRNSWVGWARTASSM
jgi:phosphohistidine phosphatase SixA